MWSHQCQELKTRMSMSFQTSAPPSIVPRLSTRPTPSLVISTRYGVRYRYIVTPYSYFNHLKTIEKFFLIGWSDWEDHNSLYSYIRKYANFLKTIWPKKHFSRKSHTHIYYIPSFLMCIHIYNCTRIWVFKISQRMGYSR